MKAKWNSNAILSGVLATTMMATPVFAEDVVKLGLVTFLSGPAAGPAGVPARNGAELIIEAINQGRMPPPYDQVGIAGQMVEPVFIDENSKQKVADYKKLVSKQEVDAVIGYISSGSCKAIAPVAEEETALTIFVSCGTPQIFEEIVTDPKYTFRSTGHATSGAVGAARYILETQPDLETISGLNQNYAWGHDSWRDFSQSVSQLKATVGIANEQFPKIFAGQYGSEITSLLTNETDVVHSSLWGGDLEAFVIQASSRGVFDKSRVVLTADVPMELLGNRIPDGTVMGARGPHNPFTADTALNKWFYEEYTDRFGSEPIGASYQMVQGILAMKAAADAAGAVDADSVSVALTGLNFPSPEGEVKMALSDGHQAIIDIAYGEFKWDEESGKGKLINVKSFSAECVNPSEGEMSVDWIKSGLNSSGC